MSKVNSDGYINIQGWMVSELGLKGNELLIYAIIYGFSQDGESKFTGSRQYLADWTNTTVKNVQNVLNSLVDKGFLNKYEKYINNLKFCEYKALKIEIIQSEEKVHEEGKNYTGVGKNFPKGRKKTSHNNLINNLEYKLDITTTNQDNINYKDQDTNQPEKASSSSFEKNIKEIKSYLLENIKDIPTCKNIMFLVENIGLSLERIKEVVNYATKYQKGIGFIYKALEENWTLKDITYSTEKNDSTTPTARGHKFNSEAIDSTIEAKEAKEEYTAKIDRLQGIYQVLSDTEKKKVDDEAYQLAVEQYGVTVAKIMARTKTKFEILEKYYLLKKGA